MRRNNRFIFSDLSAYQQTAGATLLTNGLRGKGMLIAYALNLAIAIGVAAWLISASNGPTLGGLGGILERPLDLFFGGLSVLGALFFPALAFFGKSSPMEKTCEPPWPAIRKFCATPKIRSGSPGSRKSSAHALPTTKQAIKIMNSDLARLRKAGLLHPDWQPRSPTQ
jgi:hypothetical protein